MNTFTDAYNATSRLRDEAAKREDLDSFTKLNARLDKLNTERSQCGLKTAADSLDFMTRIMNRAKNFFK